MAAKSNLVNMVLCLTLVCLFCAAVLGGMYALTYEPICKASEKTLKKSIGEVLPAGVEISDVRSGSNDGISFEYYLGNENGTVTCYAVKSVSVGFGGPLSLMVGVLRDGTVYNTSVLSHSETPGLGAKCKYDEKFISQWSLEKRGERMLDNLALTKDGGDIDAITASTITSRAYALAVSNAVRFVKSLNAGGKDNE